MYNNKYSKPSLPKKQRSFPKILPRIIYDKPDSGRLNFPKKDDSSLFEGVGRKHYGYSNSTSLQKLMSPEVQLKIDDYRRKKQEQKHHIQLNSVRQKSQTNMPPPQTNEQLYFSSKGKKQRIQTQLQPQVNYNSLKTQESKHVYRKLPSDRLKNIKILKTDVQVPLSYNEKMNLAKRSSLLKNSHLRVIGGTEDVYKAIQKQKQTPKKTEKRQIRERLQIQVTNHQPNISRALNPTYNSLGILY